MVLMEGFTNENGLQSCGSTHYLRGFELLTEAKRPIFTPVRKKQDWSNTMKIIGFDYMAKLS